MNAALLLFLIAAVAGESPSKACLACHRTEVVEAIDEHDGHPIAVEYNMVRAFAAGKLKPAQSPSGFGSTIARDLLVEGRVECVSCHVAHSEETTQPHRLRLPGREQADAEKTNPAKLCLACHELQ